jgi:acyl-coenzyme A thioesterase PaaI-like protein
VTGLGDGPDGALAARVATSIRHLGAALVSTAVTAEDLAGVLVSLDAATEVLTSRRRPPGEPAPPGMFNPVSGAANPIAPPLRVDPARSGRWRCTATVVLGEMHEGPLGHAHGGTVAALLDDVLGWLGGTCAPPVVTSRLAVRYRRPVPLGVPLSVTGTVTAVEGRRMTLRGVLTAERAPGRVLAEAEGCFVTLSAGQIASLYDLPGCVSPAECGVDGQQVSAPSRLPSSP